MRRLPASAPMAGRAVTAGGPFGSPGSRRAGARSWGTWVLAVVLGALVLVPVARLAMEALSGGASSIRAAFSGPGWAGAVVHSFAVAAAATALAVPAGFGLALVTERSAVRGRTALRLAALLPLVTPSFVLGFSWSQAYGRGGLLDDLVGLSLPGLFGPVGIVLVQAVATAPLAYLIVVAALAPGREADLERAARVTGATRLEAFRTITMPLLRGPLAAGAVLAFVASLESFGVPAVLGTPAGFATMTTRIYQSLALSADPRAFTEALVLALALVVVVLVLVVPVDRSLRAGEPITGAGGPGGAAVAGRPGRAGRTLLGVAPWAYLALAVAVPLAALLLGSFTRALGVAPGPGNWTLAHYRDALAAGALPALGRSAGLAGAAGVALLALGWLAAAVEARPGGRTLGSLVMLSFAVPGSGLAAAVLIAYGRWLEGSALLILVAYLAKFWTLAHRPLSAGLGRLPPGLVRAARASGAGPLTAWRTVVAPALVPAAGAAFALVFLFAFHELTMSSLLYGPGTETLAVVALNLEQMGDVGATSALAVLLVAVTLAAAGALLLVGRGLARRGLARRRASGR